MKDTVRNFAIDWQDWASRQNLTLSELAQWTEAIKTMAGLADESGELKEELEENGVL